MGLLAVALIGGTVLLISGDDDDSGGGSDGNGGNLTQTLNKRGAGLTAAYPEGWKRTESKGIINLESPDRCVVVSLAAPVPAGLAGRLQSDTVAEVRRSSGKAEVRNQPRAAPIGGAPTSSALIAVQAKGGSPVAISTSVSRGPKLAHLTQVVIRNPSCQQSISQSQAIVGSIAFSR